MARHSTLTVSISVWQLLRLLRLSFFDVSEVVGDVGCKDVPLVVGVSDDVAVVVADVDVDVVDDVEGVVRLNFLFDFNS